VGPSLNERLCESTSNGYLSKNARRNGFCDGDIMRGLLWASIALASFHLAACTAPTVEASDPPPESSSDAGPGGGSDASGANDAGPPPPKPVVVQKDIDKVDKAITDYMQKYSVPAVSLAIAHDEKLVYVKAYGTNGSSDSTPVTKNSLFRIASISKPITATGILLLVQRGQLSLDDKVFGSSGLLSEFSSSNLAGFSDITVSHLLHHTSGNWPNDSNDPMWEEPALSGPDLLQWTLDNYPDRGKRGTYAYSNFGFFVLGRVIEKVSGQKYEDFIREQVLTPSGISDMTIGGGPVSQRKPNEVAYAADHGDPYEINVSRMDANAGWLATATDLVRFMVRVDRFAKVPDLLSSATEATMITPSAGNAYYACGWHVNEIDSQWHDGIFYGTATDLIRAKIGFSWALLSNRGDPQNQPLNDDLGGLLWPLVRDSTIPWQDEDQF
jgi:CubicO group peptidase (beta-lactamase class C family)